MTTYDVFNTNPVKNCKWYYNKLNDNGYIVHDPWVSHAEGNEYSGFELDLNNLVRLKELVELLGERVFIDNKEDSIIIDDFDESRLGITLEDYINQTYEQ